MNLNRTKSGFISGVAALAVGVLSGAVRGDDRADAPGRAHVSSNSLAAPAPKLGVRPAAARPKSDRAPPSKIVQVGHEGDEHRPGGADDDEMPEALVAADAHLDPLQALLAQEATPIDLSTVLRLAGQQNPEILLGQQHVVEAVALRQLAAAQFLPTLNLGTSVDVHRGVLQQSNGNILSIRRESLFVGAGAYAIAAGTVNIPGVLWTLNVSDAIFNYLASRQEVDRSSFDSQAINLDVLLRVALAYNDLVRSEGMRSVSIITRNDARELARLTSNYEATGQGRKSDADRAATELARRDANLYEAEGNVVRASAAMCRLLHLDPSIRLHAADNQVIPRSIVPDPISLPELLAIALLNRPELNERRVAAARALLSLKGAQMLPFSPTVFLGFSAGGFGGGSDVAAAPLTSLPFGRNQPRFTTLDDRQDLDVMAYWTLQNLGVGNRAQINVARSRLSSADLELLITLDRVRSEVAGAHARTHSRFAQIRTCELAITAGLQAFEEDMNRIRGAEGLPLEVIDSLRLLARSREKYLNAILDYNQAQFQLYVALGKPPSELLLRPAPAEEMPPP